MAGTISVYDTVAQGRTVLIEEKRPQLLQDRYFGTREPEDLFDAKAVLLDLDNGDYESGAFVKKGYVDGNTTTFFANSVIPPRIGVEDTIDTADKDRVIFEQLCRPQGGLVPSHADALDALLRIKASRCVARASRSIERLCSLVLQTNAIQFTMDTSPTDSTQVTIDVEYFDSTGGAPNPQLLMPGTGVDGTGTATKNWDGTGSAAGSASPYDDVCDMITKLVEHGGRAEDLLMSEKSWRYLHADMLAKNLINDQIHYTVLANGDINGLFSEQIKDAKCVGQAMFNGHVLNLIVYNGACKVGGVWTPYLPDNFVCVLAPECGHTMCGCASLPNPMAMIQDGIVDVKQVVGKYLVSKYYDFKDLEVKVRCESNPLPAPLHSWGWITLGTNT